MYVYITITIDCMYILLAITIDCINTKFFLHYLHIYYYYC